jgi:hypothetical protein
MHTYRITTSDSLLEIGEYRDIGHDELVDYDRVRCLNESVAKNCANAISDFCKKHKGIQFKPADITKVIRENSGIQCTSLMRFLGTLEQSSEQKELLGKFTKKCPKNVTSEKGDTMSEAYKIQKVDESDIKIEHLEDNEVIGEWTLTIPTASVRNKCFDLLMDIYVNHENSLDIVCLEALETAVNNADVRKEYDVMVKELIDQGVLPACFDIKKKIKARNKLTTTTLKEESTMDIKEIIKLKMMTKILNKKGEIDVKQLMMIQMLSNDEGFEITDVIKTKLMASLFDGKADLDNMTTEQLMVYGMLQNGEFDIQKLIEIKFMSKILDEDDEEVEDDKDKAAERK